MTESRRTELRVVGLISGTSADAVDAALCVVSLDEAGDTIALERSLAVPYDDETRDAVLRLARNQGSVRDVARWNVRLGERFADAVSSLLRGERADLIGSHGQTVAHLVGEGEQATLQIGLPAIIAARTGVTVVSDFRQGDIAVNGQGAPLVPLLDVVALTHEVEARVALNIGGIANVTYLPPRHSDSAPVAFDTGPGNALIDAAAALLLPGGVRRDEGGTSATRGHVIPDVLETLLSHEYFSKPFPKSTGRETFGEAFAEAVIGSDWLVRANAADVLATLAAFTARSIADGIRSLPPVDRVVVSGGGVNNTAIMRFLRAELPDCIVDTSEQYGLPVDMKEAMAFALLATRTVYGLPGNIPSCTGADREAVLGSITPGSNFLDLIAKVAPS